MAVSEINFREQQAAGARTRGVQKHSIRFPNRYWPPSNVEYLISETRFFGSRIFDIRSAVRRMSYMYKSNRLS